MHLKGYSFLDERKSLLTTILDQLIKSVKKLLADCNDLVDSLYDPLLTRIHLVKSLLHLDIHLVKSLFHLDLKLLKHSFSFSSGCLMLLVDELSYLGKTCLMRRSTDFLVAII